MFAGSGYSNDDIDNNDDTKPNYHFMRLNWPCANCGTQVKDTEAEYFQRVNFLPEDAYKELYANYLNGRVWCVGCLAKRGLFKNYNGGDK